MFNIGSRTSSTLVLQLLLLLVLGYYYASNVVLEESMMQVSFGLTTPPSKSLLFFLGKKAKKKVTLLILLPLGIYVEWLRKFSFSSRGSYFRRDLRRVEIEVIEYCVDRLFAGNLWWFLRFIQTAFPELVHMALCFLVPGEYRPVRHSLVWWCLLLRMSCCFCRPRKELYR